MNWKDTVMSDKEIGEVLATEFRRTSGRDAGRYFDDISANDRVIAQAQAEVSFDKGRKEVVEWLEPRLGMTIAGLLSTNIDYIEWQTFKKSLGIEPS